MPEQQGPTAAKGVGQGRVLGVLWIKGLDGTSSGEHYRILGRLSPLAALALWVAQMKEGSGSPSRN